MRCAVRVRARLAGMGRKSVCEVVAIKTTYIATGETFYSHCHLITAPEDWPDGEYTLDIDGHTAAARREGGLWLAPDEPDSPYMPRDYAAAD